LSARPILVDATDLGLITAPTLLSWGEQDALFPREEQEQGRRDPQRQAARVPGDAPLPETGIAPERVADDLDAFLRQ
jgi:pimeloyl-ACP methyl ester carboxylesterase